MKRTFLFILLLLLTEFLTAQTKNKQDFEKKLYVELKGRTSFMEVNRRYQLLTDTIFHTNSGFKIFPEYDFKTIDGVKYIILRYPNFTNGKQSIRTDFSEIKKETAIDPVHTELNKQNEKLLAIKESEFNSILKESYYSTSFKKISNYNLSFGILTVPFKLRPKKNDINSNITTDITIGPYLGLTKRIAPRKRYYITIPANIGLSYININDNNTSNTTNDNDINVVPGITWSTGIIFQLSDFNIGFVTGQDFASGIGSDWIYNNEFWYSFAIGYNFLKQ